MKIIHTVEGWSDAAPHEVVYFHITMWSKVGYSTYTTEIYNDYSVYFINE